MRYDIAKFQPHWTRLYRWDLWWKDHKRHCLLVVYALLLGAMLKTGEAYLVELNNRLSSEGAHLSLIGDVWRLTHFGEPGLVENDFVEHTDKLAALRRVK